MWKVNNTDYTDFVTHYTDKHNQCNHKKISGISDKGFTPLEIQNKTNNLRPAKAGLSLTGFTLVELLVTTSILGMIALAISSTFASGLNVYRHLQSYSGVQTDVLLSLEKIEKDLRNSFSLSGIDFTGDAQKVAFAGLIEEFDSKGNQNITLGKISYYFDEETGALIKEEQGYPQAILEKKAEKSNFKVLDFIQNINFNYYFINPQTQDYDWKNSWAKGEGLPLGVKIEVVFKDGKRDVKLVRTVLIPIST